MVDEIVLVVKNKWLTQEGLDLFLEGDTFEYIDEELDFLDILVKYGFFPSKKAAKNAGWEDKQQIQDGITDVIVGKKKRRIFIWKPTPSDGLGEGIVNQNDSIAVVESKLGREIYRWDG